jgi:predicted aconitase with swiveling domain
MCPELKIISLKSIINGICEGTIIYSSKSINFLSSVNTMTGIVNDPSHELDEVLIKDSILIFPNSTGSSVGAYSIYTLKKNGVSPKCIICTSRVDITTASGCAIADIPLFQILDQNYKIKSGQYGIVGGIIPVLKIKTD